MEKEQQILSVAETIEFLRHCHRRAPFIYDVADLYKHLTSIPAAFLAVRQNPADDGDLVRKLLKQRVEEERLLQRMPKDLEALFAPSTISPHPSTKP